MAPQSGHRRPVETSGEEPGTRCWGPGRRRPPPGSWFLVPGSFFEDGSPGEVFITISKEGSTIRGLMDSLAVMMSLALQYGVPLESLAATFKNVRLQPHGFTRNPDN